MAREMRVVPYDPRWPEQFAAIRDELSDLFGPLATAIHHIGSTAVPGMRAKPIIDVLVVVSDIEAIDALDGPMRAAGYIPRGENGIPGRRYFVMLAGDGENHLRHIHCYGPNNPHVATELLFRDILRTDRNAFRQYERVKMEAAETFRFSPGEYEAYKAACVEDILRKARPS